MRRENAVLAMLAAVVAMTAAACSSKGSGTPDAAGGGDGNNAAETSTGSCDPFAQNCAAGMKCDFGCQGTTAVIACWPNGDGGVGAPCTNFATCAAGTACIAISTAGTVCRKYCNVDGDCATGERCHNDTVGVACGAPATSLALHFCH